MGAVVVGAKEGFGRRQEEWWSVVVCSGGGEMGGQNRRDLKLPRAPIPPCLSASLILVGGKISYDGLVGLDTGRVVFS